MKFTETLNSKLSELLENVAHNLRVGNSNITAEQTDAITDLINRSTIKPKVVDRINAMSILYCSANEFNRALQCGLLKTYDDPDLSFKVYLVSDLEKLRDSGHIRKRKIEYKSRKNRI